MVARARRQGLLHTAKTKQKVEKDLLKALGITSDVEFQSPKPAGLVKIVKVSAPGEAASQAKGGLLGDFKPGGASAGPSSATGSQAVPDFVPLDPYAASEDDAGTDTKH